MLTTQMLSSVWSTLEMRVLLTALTHASRNIFVNFVNANIIAYSSYNDVN